MSSSLIYLTGSPSTTGTDWQVDGVSLNGLTISGSPTAIETGKPSNIFFNHIAFNASSNVYFISATNGSDGGQIYRETLGVTPSFTSAFQIATIPANGAGNEDTGMSVDSTNNILYYTDQGSLYADRFGSSFNNTPTSVKIGSVTQVDSTGDFVQGMVYDQAENAVYTAVVAASNYTTFTPGGHGNITTIETLVGNYIYKTSVTPGMGANTGAFTSAVATSNHEVPFSDGEVAAVALDTATDTLYFATNPFNAVAADDVAGVYALTLSGAHAGSISTVWSQTFTSTPSALGHINGITIDPLTGDYYLTIKGGKQIYSGNIDSSATPVAMTIPATAGDDSTVYVLAAGVVDPPSISSIAVSTVKGVSTTTGTVTTGNTVTFSVTYTAAVSVTINGTPPTLTLNDGGTASYTSGSGSNVLVFTYTVASGQNTGALAVTGLSTNGSSITDAAGGAASAAISTTTFNGLVVNTAPPTITLSSTSSEALQGGATIAVLAGAPTLSDPSSTLASASIVISGYQSGDVLGINGATSGKSSDGIISYSYASGTLSFSGTDSLAAYDTLFNEVTYQDQGSDSSNGAHPSRTLTWHVSDSTASGSATSSITIDRAPSIATNGEIVGVLAGGTVNDTVTGGALTGDSDLDGDSLTITALTGGALGTGLSGTYGVLTLNSNGSYSYTANNSAAIAAAPTGTLPGDQFTFTVSDGKGGSSQETFTIFVDRPPTSAAVHAALTEGATITGDALTDITDPDGDAVSVMSVNGGSVGSPSSGTYGVLTLNSNGSYSYSASNISAIDAAATGSAPVDQFIFNAADTHGRTTAETLSVTIAREPSISTGSSVTYTAGGPAITVDAGGTITNPDNAELTGAIMYLTSGDLPGAVLSFTNQNGISGNFAGGTLTLSGTATAADYQAALQSVQLSSTAADPYDNGANQELIAAIILIDAAGQGSPASAPIAISPDIDIAGGAVTSLDSINSGRDIIFTGTGATLDLTTPADFAGNVEGFADNNTIDLAGLTVASETFASGILSLYDAGGTLLDSLNFADLGGITSADFHTADDTAGGTDLTLCFYPGTRIATPDGEVAVEDLRPGDMVLTSAGPAPLRWVGRSEIAMHFANKLRSLPIRITAGALGNNLPQRDLLVSPDHALFMDDCLIHASALINYGSIRREYDVPAQFTYYHLELDQHALLFAEGALAESFIDNVDRMHFHNWDAREAPSAPIAELPYPRAKSARQLPQRLRWIWAA